MNSNKTTTELKSHAREILMGKYGVYILAFVSIQMIIFAVTMIVSLMIPEGNLWGEVLSFILTLVIDLIAAVFSLGLIRFTLNICRNQPYKVGDIYYGFTSYPDKAIIAQFLLF